AGERDRQFWQRLPVGRGLHTAIRRTALAADQQIIRAVRPGIGHREALPAPQQVDLDEIRRAQHQRLALAKVEIPSLRAPPFVRRRQEFNAGNQPQLRIPFVDLNEILAEALVDKRSKRYGLGRRLGYGETSVPQVLRRRTDAYVGQKWTRLLAVGSRQHDVR